MGTLRSRISWVSAFARKKKASSKNLKGEGIRRQHAVGSHVRFDAGVCLVNVTPSTGEARTSHGDTVRVLTGALRVTRDEVWGYSWVDRS